MGKYLVVFQILNTMEQEFQTTIQLRGKIFGKYQMSTFEYELGLYAIAKDGMHIEL